MTYNAITLVILTIFLVRLVAAEPVSISICNPGSGMTGKIFYERDGFRQLIGVNETGMAGECHSVPVPDRPVWVNVISSTDKWPQSVYLQGRFNSRPVNISDYGVQVNSAPAVVNKVPKKKPTINNSNTNLSGWYWAPELWLNKPDVLLDDALVHDLSELYITIPTSGKSVENVYRLNSFVSAARKNGLRIWAVIGDPRDVLAENHNALMDRIDAYLEYNNSAYDNEKLHGIQLDIEPYLLSGFTISPSYWRDKYLETVRKVHNLVSDKSRLNLVMPFWWGTHIAFGETFLDELKTLVSDITVMNYRTNIALLEESAEPFLVWGDSNNINIRIGLETGNLVDERYRVYFSSDMGEVWLLPLGNYTAIALFEDMQSTLPGYAYTLSHEIDVPASRISFAGEEAKLEAALVELDRVWKQWSSYSGIAIHGLAPSIELQ